MMRFMAYLGSPEAGSISFIFFCQWPKSWRQVISAPCPVPLSWFPLPFPPPRASKLTGGLANIFSLWALSTVPKGGLEWSTKQIGQVWFGDRTPPKWQM